MNGLPTAAITRISERSECWVVEGVVDSPHGWLKAGFNVSKKDVLKLSKEDFERFCLRNLPHVTQDKRWTPDGQGLVM